MCPNLTVAPRVGGGIVGRLGDRRMRDVVKRERIGREIMYPTGGGWGGKGWRMSGCVREGIYRPSPTSSVNPPHYTHSFLNTTSTTRPDRPWVRGREGGDVVGMGRGLGWLEGEREGRKGGFRDILNPSPFLLPPQTNHLPPTLSPSSPRSPLSSRHSL